MQLELRCHTTLLEIEPDAWNALAGSSPFLRHEFLTALERSGSVGESTAWRSRHLTAWSDGRLVGALPLYLKDDSFGEFVFDWGWADAYERAGRSYYPKLVSAVPFTPATGPRLLTEPETNTARVHAFLLEALRALADELDISSAHLLFTTDSQRLELEAAGYLSRKACQFHWHNAGYDSFDDFLGEFSSAKRKKARRERRRVSEAGIEFRHLRGDEPTSKEWEAIFRFYARTFIRRGRTPYLSRAFFMEIARTMPEQLLIVLASLHGEPIASAICFRDDVTLYGRYWGSLADFHSLHFEVCYYQGIEYCIREGLATFEPGTQGEHKIARGFTPTATWSNHWVGDPDFSRAVAEFLAREHAHVDAYMAELEQHVPYRSTAHAALVR